MTSIRSIVFNPVFVCVVVSVAAIAPFFVIGEVQGSGCCGGTMPVTHDMVAHFNLMQSFYDGLKEGSFYPTWQAETNRGYGAPATNFYPPAIYYLTSTIQFITRDWFATIRFLYLILMIGSGLSFYALARSYLTRSASIVAMIAYQIAPYHLINHYQRGAIAECLGLIWLPLVLLFAFDRRHSALLRFTGLAVCSGLFLWSHPPTAYQTALIFGPILVAVDVWRRQWRHLVIATFAVSAGVLIAAAYLLPALLEQKFIHAEDIAKTWPYAESFVFDYASTRYDHLKDDFIVRIDYIWLLACLQIVAATVLTWKRSLVWVVAGFISIFLMTKLSSPLTALIPGITIGVFSWRMLEIASLCGAMLAGCAFRIRRSGLAIVFSSLLFSIAYVGMPMYRAQAFKPDPGHSHFSLVPINAFQDAIDVAPVRVIAGNGKAEVIKWESEERAIRMDMQDSGTLSVRTYFFPGWTAFAGTRECVIRAGMDGEILVDVPPGNYDLTLELRPTRVRKLARAITSASLLAMIVCVGVDLFRRKRRYQSANLTN